MHFAASRTALLQRPMRRVGLLRAFLVERSPKQLRPAALVGYAALRASGPRPYIFSEQAPRRLHESDTSMTAAFTHAWRTE